MRGQASFPPILHNTQYAHSALCMFIYTMFTHTVIKSDTHTYMDACTHMYAHNRSNTKERRKQCTHMYTHTHTRKKRITHCNAKLRMHNNNYLRYILFAAKILASDSAHVPMITCFVSRHGDPLEKQRVGCTPCQESIIAPTDRKPQTPTHTA